MACKMGCTHMLRKHFLAAAMGAGLVSASWNTGYAQHSPAVQTATTLPFVSPIFGDNMVLQRNKPDKIWGWSEPGDTVHVVIGSNTASAVAGADRRWQVEIQPPPAGGPYTVKITGRQSRRASQCSGGRCLALRRPIQHGVQAARCAERRR